MSVILSDELAFLTIAEASRGRYKKVWEEFTRFSNSSDDFEKRMPSENELLEYFQHLRNKKKNSSSTLWTVYSMLNSVCKGKYSERLQKFPRITALLKSYNKDCKKKAAVFDDGDLEKFVGAKDLSTPYWLVRKVVMILAFFGGLRHTEAMDLELQNVRPAENGIYITHSRAKQRSDKRSSSFLVPKTTGEVDYAEVVKEYMDHMKTELGKFSGRFFWTGKQQNFINSPLGKNSVSNIPKEMAEFLEKENVSEFTFHSLRRSSATYAADNGATAQQMTDFYGWKSVNMAQEYISTSKNAVNNMAAILKATGPPLVDGPGAGPAEHSNDQFKPGSGVQLEQPALRSDSHTKKIVIHALTINNGTTNF